MVTSLQKVFKGNIRWKPLKDIPIQRRLAASNARFKVVPAGRRSGKTEIVGKRELILRALCCRSWNMCLDAGHPEWFVNQEDPKIAAGAPTRDQAKRIYWTDFKRLVPKKYLRASPNESSLILPLFNGADVCVVGLDRPERAEGTPWDHFCLDEYGNMKKDTWDEHLEPALNTPGREGSCDFIGVPEGRNHYYHLYKSALAEAMQASVKKMTYRYRNEPGDNRAGQTKTIIVKQTDWDTFTWFSSLVLSPQAIARAKRNLDELTYQQEYEGSFVNFSGQAYYNFRDATHCAPLKQYYNPRGELIIALDFNVAPGIAAIGQEMQRLDPITKMPLVNQESMTGWFDEVYIPRNSNTEIVCTKLGMKYGRGNHTGPVKLYGDATGGLPGSAKVMGSDWDIAKAVLARHFSGEQLHYEYAKGNPAERVRVNSMNARLFTVTKEVKMMVDPSGAPKSVLDLEGVRLLEGGSGEIDKKYDLTITHLSDAMGYYVHREFPISVLIGGMQDVIGA